MIEVLFFAELRDQAGRDRLEIDASNLTVRELIDNHLKAYDLLTIDKAMIAVNEEYANEDKLLKAGDVLAFIPPVSGG